MVDLKIDSETKSMTLQVMLKGEEKPLNLSIKKYSIINRDNKTFIDISEIESNREWINLLFDSLFKSREIEIPEKYAPLLDIAL